MKINKLLIFLIGFLLLGIPIMANAQVNVSLPNEIVMEAGETDTIPVTVSSLSGEGVLSFEGDLSYDTSVVEITGVLTDGTISEAMTSVDGNYNEAAEVFSIAAYGSSELSGYGTLLNLEVKYKQTGETTLAWDNFMFNEGTPAAVTSDADVYVGAVELDITSLTGDAGDTAMVDIAVSDLTGKGILSYEGDIFVDTSIAKIVGVEKEGTRSESMTSVDINYLGSEDVYRLAAYGSDSLSGSGTLVQLQVALMGSGKSDLNIESFMFNEGNPSAILDSAYVSVNTIDTKLPDTLVAITDTGNLPVTVEDITGTNILSYEADIACDTSIMEITGVSKAGTISETMTSIDINYIGSENVYRIAAYGSSALTGAGTLFELEVMYKETGVSPLTWESFQYNEGSPVPELMDGQVEVVSVPVVEFTTDSVNFGDVNVGMNKSDSLYVKNTGSSELVIDSMNVSLETVTASIADDTVAAGDSVMLSLTFTPAMNVAYSGMFTLYSNAGENTLPVTGTGILDVITIAEARVDEDGDYVPDKLGEVVKTTGIVTTPNFGSDFSDFYMQDNEAGINIYKPGEILNIAEGDEIVITGEIDQYNGKTEIIPDTIEILSQGNDLPAELQFEDIDDYDSKEGMLVQMDDARLLEQDAWPEEGNWASIDIYEKVGDENDTITMFLDSETDLDGWTDHPVFDAEGVSEKFDLVGILSQYDYSEPYDSDYQIIPRSTGDIRNIEDRIETQPGMIPDEFALRDNYPNPFNPTTHIAFDVPRKSDVSLRIYSIDGRLVKEMKYEKLKAGYHTYHFNASNLSSGIYLYRLKADGFTQVKKMTLIK